MSDSSSMRSVSCPNCDTVYKIPATVKALTARCRVCQNSFSIQKPASPQPPRKTGTQPQRRPVPKDAIQSGPAARLPNAKRPALPLDFDAFVDEPGAPIPSVKKRKSHLVWIVPVVLIVIAAGSFGAYRLVNFFEAQWVPALVEKKEPKPENRQVALANEEKQPRVEEPQIPLVKEPFVKEPLVKEPLEKEPPVKEPPVKEPAAKELQAKEPPVKKKDTAPEVKKQPRADENEPMLERRKTHLIVRHEMKQYAVKFEATANLTTTNRMGQPEHVFVARHAAQLQEKTEKIDDVRNYVFLRFDYKTCTLDFDLDGKKNAVIMLNQEERTKHLPAVAWTKKVSGDNHIFDVDLDVSQVPDLPGLRRQTASFHQSHFEELHRMVWIPMPEKEPDQLDYPLMAPGDNWSDSWKTAMANAGGKGQGSTRDLETIYTYLGIRKQQEREEAVIHVKATVRETRGKEVRLSADGEGKAYLDLEAREITRVDLDFKLAFETGVFVINGDSKGTGTLKLRLQRDLVGNP